MSDAAHLEVLKPRAAGKSSTGPTLRVTPPPETVVSMVTLGGIVYVATTSDVYRVEGDRLVRLVWPTGPRRKRKKEG